MCHVPFGHTIEDDLELLIAHDKNASRFDDFWGQLDPEFREVVSSDLKRELRRLILSKEDIPAGEPASRYPFVGDLVGNTICADLMDYPVRDHQNLGLPIALGHRWLEGLFVSRSDHPHHQSRVAVEIRRNGQTRSDVISELLKYLRYRYELSERALMHGAKLAVDAMIGKILGIWKDMLFVEVVAGAFGSIPDAGRRDVDELRRWLSEKQPDELVEATERVSGAKPGSDANAPDGFIEAVDNAVVDRLEQTFRVHGDDGLLELLLAEGERLAADGDSRADAIASLCRDVLNRRLYKCVGRSLTEEQTRANTIWAQHGRADDKRRRELEAADFIVLRDDRWHVVLWVPSPDMKLKPADVFVGDDEKLDTLHEYSKHQPGRRVEEIYDSHEALWGVSVYVHPDLATDRFRCDMLLAHLRTALGVQGWVDHPQQDTNEIAVEEFASLHDLTVDKKRRLLAGVAGKSDGAAVNLERLMERLETLHQAM